MLMERSKFLWRNFPQERLLTKLHIEVSQHVSTDISIVHLLHYVSFVKLPMKATYLKYKGNQWQ